MQREHEVDHQRTSTHAQEHVDQTLLAWKERLAEMAVLDITGLSPWQEFLAEREDRLGTPASRWFGLRDGRDMLEARRLEEARRKLAEGSKLQGLQAKAMAEIERLRAELDAARARVRAQP